MHEFWSSGGIKRGAHSKNGSAHARSRLVLPYTADWPATACEQLVSGSGGIVSQYRIVLIVNVERKYIHFTYEKHSII